MFLWLVPALLSWKEIIRYVVYVNRTNFDCEISGWNAERNM